jgi:DNA-binding CsgD family transcriptional regulator
MRAKILEHFDTRIAAAQAEVDSFKPRSRPIELSPRQIEAFKLIGLTSETMSQRLGISKRSAVNLVTVIMEELNVPNRASAVLKAIKLGILKFEDFEIGERD